MSPAQKAKSWNKANPERFRENQRESYQRRKAKDAGRHIPANDPKAIAQWWRERGHA